MYCKHILIKCKTCQVIHNKNIKSKVTSADSEGVTQWQNMSGFDSQYRKQKKQKGKYLTKQKDSVNQIPAVV